MVMKKRMNIFDDVAWYHYGENILNKVDKEWNYLSFVLLLGTTKRFLRNKSVLTFCLIIKTLWTQNSMVPSRQRIMISLTLSIFYGNFAIVIKQIALVIPWVIHGRTIYTLYFYQTVPLIHISGTDGRSSCKPIQFQLLFYIFLRQTYVQVGMVKYSLL